MKLLLAGAFKFSETEYQKIESLGYDILFVQDERVPLVIDVSDIEAVVCNGLFLYNDISGFKSLKLIQLTSAGLDRVPLQYITEHQIKLLNARGVYSIPVAEWAVLKILEIYKKSMHFYKAQNERKWQKQTDILELAGKTAVIIGVGSVGMEIAKRLKAFGVKVLGVDTRTLSTEETCMIDVLYEPAETEEAISASDIVILTLSLTEKTRHLMNGCRFAAMKQNSVLINVSRGGVIDEAALKDNLRNGKFLGVALDVFEEEPLPESSDLWDYERLIITPHNSFVSEKVNERLFELIVKNLKEMTAAQKGESAEPV